MEEEHCHPLICFLCFVFTVKDVNYQLPVPATMALVCCQVVPGIMAINSLEL